MPAVVSGATVLALTASLGVTAATAGVAQADDGPSGVTTQARTAAQRAQTTGVPVEITGERTDYATTYAQPDGVTFTLEQSAVPVRVRQADGSWAAPDATLVHRADGTVGPRAAAVDMAFSGGGDGGDLVTLAKDGQSLKLSWPGHLPAPTLSGTTAVYADVLPGVDLQMRATTEGYHEGLVVNSAQAAANPDLARLEFPLHARGLTIRDTANGGLSAVDANGNAVFRAPVARQWDSAGDDPGTSGATAAPAQGRLRTAAAGEQQPPTDVLGDGDDTPDPTEVCPSGGHMTQTASRAGCVA